MQWRNKKRKKGILVKYNSLKFLLGVQVNGLTSATSADGASASRET
jgi:hypothetical protein